MAARAWWVLFGAGLLVAACSGDQGGVADPAGGGAWSSASSGEGGAGATTGAGAGGAGGGASTSTGAGGGLPDVLCPTTVRVTSLDPLPNARLAGEWHGFDLATATALAGPTVTGEYTATVELPPGLHAYKVVHDEGGEPVWELNPTETRRKYVDGVENSAVLVRHCALPELRVQSSAVGRAAPGQGTFTASLTYHDAVHQSGADPSGFEATLHRGQSELTLPASAWSVAADGSVNVSLAGLSDGKYRLLVRARSAAGAEGGGYLGEPVRLVFWVEEEAFDWRDAVVYMIMTDRFADGDPSNNGPVAAGADPRGDFQGGDLQGVTAAIEDGTLDALGIRAIWLSPWQTNPDGGYLASDNSTLVTGYHGYWPVKAREVDARLGGAQALHDLVEAAHAHGIRILQDYVINHVHEDHEYNLAHPEWFRTGCVCGTDGCDWTINALECTFRDYMPDIDHRVPAANQAFVDDAIWWLDTFDLDGLRIDAVKHVEEIATRNLSVAVRETFEAAGTRYFLMGETAMGWGDCADPCNDENYGTIARYVGPHGLDGQFDFVLYHAASYLTFAHGDRGMVHADYWLKHGLAKWPEGAIMTPYIGSHDTPRFVSLADYRGQSDHPKHVPGNQWFDIAEAPSDAEPYRRMRVALSWLYGLPGAPLLYYGDEYGQWGGADPNNRLMWRPPGELAGEEAATLALARKLGAARRELVALRRGAYQTVSVTEDTLVFARRVAGSGEVALVGLTRSGGPVSVPVSLAALGLSGAQLTDRLGGPPVTVNGAGMATLTIPGAGAVVLAP